MGVTDVTFCRIRLTQRGHQECDIVMCPLPTVFHKSMRKGTVRGSSPSLKITLRWHPPLQTSLWADFEWPPPAAVLCPGNSPSRRGKWLYGIQEIATLHNSFAQPGSGTSVSSKLCKRRTPSFVNILSCA